MVEAFINREEDSVNKTQATKNKLFWDQFLEVGRKRRTDDEWWQARGLARSWNTCACGSINDGLPRIDRGAWKNQPKDIGLITLGTSFFYEVKTRNLNKIRTLFSRIQTRSAEVLGGL